MATTVPPPRGPADEGPVEVLIREAEAPSDSDARESAGSAPAKDGRPVPRLADGVELIGVFEDSGFKEPPYIARRADGQVVQMPQMLYALADEIDGTRTSTEVADALSHRIERGVSGEMAEMLIDEQLRPLGVVAEKDGEPHELKKIDPLLALKFKAKAVPDRAVLAVTALLRPLFLPPVVAAVVAGLVALDVWLFGIHGISQSLRHLIYQPALLLMLLGGVIAATVLHEVGHATACRYGGAKPGVMGVGIYIVWPAFYTDITDAYRLNKRGRLRTDLGGMYFNALFALLVAGAYAATGFEPLLLLIVLQTFAIVQQALPFLRLDGYYILSDLTGVPDILLRIRPVLASLIPGRPADERVTQLKRWVRVVVTAYLLVLVPLIALMFLVMLINAPRLFATGWDSFLVHFDQVGPAFDHGQAAAGVASVVQMLVLALPALGMVYSGARIGSRAARGGWSWSAGSAAKRGAFMAGWAALVGALAFLWWPHGEYRPIQRGERGTLTGAFSQIAHIPTGRPSLTAARQQQLDGAPTVRQLRHAEGGQGAASHAKPTVNGAANHSGAAAKRSSGIQGSPGQSPGSSGSTPPSSAGQSQQGTPGSPPADQSQPAPSPPPSSGSGSTTTTAPSSQAPPPSSGAGSSTTATPATSP